MDIDKALTSAATSDMATARREGSFYICQTKHGTLELSYDRSSKTYTLIRVGNPERSGQVLAEGAARAVKPTLKGCYVVVL